MDPDIQEYTEDDAVEAYLKSAEETDEQDAPESPQDAPESGEDEGGWGEASEAPDADAEPSEGVPEDTVEILIGEEKKSVNRKDLERLYADRASIAKSAQHVHAQNRAVEAQGMFLAQLYDARIKRAQEVAEKYSKVDLWAAHRELGTQEFNDLKANKEAAEAELAALNHEASSFLEQAQATRQTFIREAAAQAIPAIRQAIPEWSDTLYNDLRSYAVGQGMDQTTVNEIVDPAAIVMMRKAMLYDQAQKKSETVVKKAVTAPKKVVGKPESRSDTTKANASRLVEQARATGDIDDVTAAFLAAQRDQ
ncbi:hypothetical protein [Paracoccus sp. (in: a-proteobacteria)]|uniref:hypothetical protein n=1 Tax=Paracoccus sp. TaxID=267 RepID=UPI0026E0B9F6|nr:hypothetical protein [Paracoccus sp. (in: a-proteobacteria)]MDO5647367.1 hypothetical protein [Paracoccus sp. (in: a-proteobacteria)]